ncbi:hypothetical protein ABLE91_01275 [Aquabacter sp. CN5-332]|uniref:hypothetical protein n=1 Tax=Aquabacter sp. CN5-332 TaxID=3156608 RepID=UPI0032B5C03E
MTQFGPGQSRSFGPRPAPLETPQDLLAVWRDGGAQHMALGAGCGCSGDGVVLQLSDFEQDIVDYLLAEAERGERADVIALLQGQGRLADGRWNITLLLEHLGAQPEKDEAREFVVSRLKRTLASFATRHRMTASAV